MASSTRSTLRRDLNLMLHQNFEVDTATSGTIQVGDLIEVNLTTRLVALMEDDTPTAGCAYIGISNSYWASGMNDSALKTNIEVLGCAIVEAPLTSGTYTLYTAVQYDASADDGHLKSWDTGNTIVGWIWAGTETGTITSGKVLINILNPTGGVLELTS